LHEHYASKAVPSLHFVYFVGCFPLPLLLLLSPAGGGIAKRVAEVATIEDN